MRETYWRQVEGIVGLITRGDFAGVGQQGTRNAIEAFILERSTRSTRLLDAGCNTGVVGFRLFQKGFKGTYVGADSNLKALSHALRNLSGFPASLVYADLEAVGYPDRHFDIVLVKDVIEHAPTFQGIQREMARLTGSWLVLSMFIRMHDDPDVLRDDPPGLFHNRYQRQPFYHFMKGMGFEASDVLHEEGDDEVLVFRRAGVARGA